jgi:hypothetical protein
MSVSQPNFSLNGTHRNQGYVGQTTLSRSLPRSLMRGNTLRGYGGCCGSYKITPSIISAVTSTEDSNVIKSSVLSNMGMLDTKYRWIQGPHTSVKPDTGNNLNISSQYTERLAKQTMNELNNGPCMKTPSTIAILRRCDRNCQRKTDYTKPEDSFVPISNGQYIIRMNNTCSSNDVVYIPNQRNNTPLPGNGRRY